ncbi:MAG: amino acid adenylation domain-containing protein [Acidobacteriaceae bacterium]|nr:amino acid adenylation domain-containing protein [Acidobacteriaceae bacterium]
MLRRHSLIVPPLTRVARPPRIPLSFAQQRLWFIHQLEPGNEQYSIPYLMRLTGRLNGTVLEQSLNEIVRRHEVLRSRFIMEDGEALQVVEPSAAVPFVITDLTKLPADHREQEAHRMVTKEIERPFDLSAAPMFRALLIRLDESDHVFAITLHHAVCDGWSLDVLSEELTAFYDAFLENRSPQLKELAVQYADYTLWQHEFLSSVRLEKEIEYWKQQLAGAPAILNLPCDRPRPPRPTLVGAQASVLLPAALLEELKRLGHGEGATLFMTLLATLNVLLWRYSGQDDIAVGCPIAGRNRVELEPLIGFFVNTLVLRTSLAGNPTFRNLLNRVRQTALNAYAHQDLPFEKLVGEMNPTRDAAQNPLFRVAFVLQNMPRQNRKIGELAVTPFAIKTSKSKFDLTLIAHEHVDGLRLNLQYSTDLFDEPTIGRMLQHYQALLECIVKEPDLEISDLSFLTASEQHLLFDWGSATSEYARESSIQHLFDQQAATRENAVALECGETGMTYGELQHRANQFAHYLRCRGIGTGALVSICMERSIELVVTILGILKAGAAYVPLDPDYPPERLSFMLEDTCAALLVTQDRLLEDVASTLGTPVICLDRDRDLIARQQPTQQLPIGAPDDLAYVMYTSGSTGRPKGVAVPHRGVVRLVNNPNYASFTPEDVLLQFAPISFDASTLEIWGALLNGAKLVISPSRNASLDELATTIQGKGITTLWLTAGLFHLMVEHHLKRLRGVRQLLAGGDVLSISHVRRAVQELQGCRIINGYGPTENTTFTCCHTITLDTIGASVPIGRPLSNTQVYILDERQKLVPIGVVGELCTGGDGLARAYVNSPELTKERFVEVNGLGRLYRTGDRCRWRSDGLIEFVGRLDNQVKLRGYRIELGEVEAALNQQPGVAQSVAVIREDKPGVRQLVAYVLPQPGSPPQNGNLLGHLRKSLPEFMVPAAVIVIDEFPLGPNGKIDRRALPKPEMTLAQEARLSGPRDEFEHRLLHIWKQVLGVNSCSLTDNFFELGGHSLLLLRLEAMIEKEFKKVVPLSFLFRSANIESIAAFLRIDSKPEPEIFVPLKEQGAGPAFFCVHEVMGEVMMFRHFAKFLNPDQRFFGVQFPPEERAPECVTSIEAVAARYVDALLAFQPEGPYLLGGWSAGASVALEMAQQLQARGRNVGLLVAIDAAPPNTGVPESRKTLRYYCDLVRNVPRWIADELIATFSWRQFFIRAVRRLSSPVKRVLANRRGSDARIKYTIDRINKAGNYPERTRVFIDAFYRILLRYKPKPYNGRVVLYKAMTQDLSSLREPERVWKALATHVDVVPVRGTHVSLLEERHCQQFADDLNARLKPFRDSWADKKRTVNHPPDREPSMSLREESTVADLEWSRSAVVQS